jgi:tetratricopeptide (TPR) repeat protein
MAKNNEQRIRDWAVAFTVALITTLVYLPALKNGFVNWDDPAYVYENQYIRSIDFEFFKWMFTTFHASNWHPLTWLSHTIDYAIWGLNPTGHHLTSIILHGLNTFLVVILIIRLVNYANLPLTPDNPPTPPLVKGGKGGFEKRGLRGITQKGDHTSIIAGVVTGLLFGLHPLHVESVAWVSERKDVLYAFFFLLSILSYLKYTSLQKQGLSGHSSPVTRHRWYFLCLIFFILSLMSKPMAVTLPVVLLILDIYPLRRLNLKSASYNPPLPTDNPPAPPFLKGGKGGFEKGGRGGIKVLIEKIPFLGLSLASSVVTIIAQQSGEAMATLEQYPLWVRICVAIRALGFYLFKMLWPTDLCPLYPYPPKISFLTIEYMGAFILVVCITAFCIWSWKRQKVFLAIWAYYLVTLLPVLGIIQVGTHAAADRYMYLPSLGHVLLIGLGVSWLWVKAKIRHNKSFLFLKKISIIIVAAFVTVHLSILTVKQIKIWRDSLTLWNTEIKRFPNGSPLIYINRGNAYTDLRWYHYAIEDYRTAIKLNPDNPKAYYNMGLAYDEKGSINEASYYYQQALKLKPDYPQALSNLGIIYGKTGRFEEATELFKKALNIAPDDTITLFNLGLAYEELAKGYELQAMSHEQLAKSTEQSAKSRELTAKAIETYQKVLKLEPDNTQAKERLSLIMRRSFR